MLDVAYFINKHLLLKIWLAFECNGINDMGLSIRIRSLMLDDLLIKPFDHFMEFRMLFVFDSIVKTLNYANIISPIIRWGYIKEIEAYSIPLYFWEFYRYSITIYIFSFTYLNADILSFIVWLELSIFGANP